MGVLTEKVRVLFRKMLKIEPVPQVKPGSCDWGHQYQPLSNFTGEPVKLYCVRCGNIVPLLGGYGEGGRNGSDSV